MKRFDRNDFEEGEIESDENDHNEIESTKVKIERGKNTDVNTIKHFTNITTYGDESMRNGLDNTYQVSDKGKHNKDWIGNSLRRDTNKVHLMDFYDTSMSNERHLSYYSSTSGRKRKRKQSERDLKKRLKDADKQIQLSNLRPVTEEEIDEYEILNISGGSPPASSLHSTSTRISSTVQQHQLTDSENGYTSFDGYESSECYKNDNKPYRNGTKFDDKRNSKSDDDVTHRPRKQELCKFYLMGSCAKRNKCLYMHSDFPCKYYYLGIKNHSKNNCKFSHGKPLNEQLRNILLKHLETAPKELLGDFPHISSKIALSMLNTQHMKLLLGFGMENNDTNETGSVSSSISSAALLPTPSILPSSPTKIITSIKQQNQKHLYQHHQQQQQQQQHHQHQHQHQQVSSVNTIPSLLELDIKFTSDLNRPSMSMKFNDINDKPNQSNKFRRKSRWSDLNSVNNFGNNYGMNRKKCHSNTSTNFESISSTILDSIGSSLQSTEIDTKITKPTRITSSSMTLSSTFTNNTDSFLKINSNINLNNFSEVITQEQLDKLHAIGVVNIDQVTLLTLEQLIEIGLSVIQIYELQLYALNIKEIFMVSSRPTVSSLTSFESSTATETVTLTTSTSTFNSTISSLTSSTSDMLRNTEISRIQNKSILSRKDLDFRFLPTHFARKSSQKNITLGNYDIDMRFINSNKSSSDSISPSSHDTILAPHCDSGKQQPSHIHYKPEHLKQISFESSETTDSRGLLNDNIVDELSIEIEASPLLIIENDSGSAEEANLQVIDGDKEKVENDSLPASSFFSQQSQESIQPATYGPWSPKTVTKKIDVSSYVTRLFAEQFPDDADIVIVEKKSEQLELGNSSNKLNEIIERDKETLLDLPSISSSSSSSELASTLPTSTQSTILSTESPVKLPQTAALTKISSTVYDNKHKTYHQLQFKRRVNNRDKNFKDKDMRLSVLFEENDFETDDVDLRIPFTQAMSNYTPATEIHASITSHSGIPYKLIQIEIPKPDYGHIRKGISVRDLDDPRLKRIAIANDDIKSLIENVADLIRYLRTPRIDPRLQK